MQIGDLRRLTHKSIYSKQENMITPRNAAEDNALEARAKDMQVGTLSQALPKDGRPLESYLCVYWVCKGRKPFAWVEGRSPGSCLSLALASRALSLAALRRYHVSLFKR